MFNKCRNVYLHNLKKSTVVQTRSHLNEFNLRFSLTQNGKETMRQKIFKLTAIKELGGANYEAQRLDMRVFHKPN